MKPAKKYERYQRQLTLKGFGITAQEKLLQAKALVIGAGGLGCPALQYLAGAGLGTIGIVDDDLVSLSNLHRQVLYNMNDIGLPKATVAAATLQALNNEIHIIPYNLRLTNQNALDIIAAYDIIIDGSDNFSTRYLINDACVLLNKPLVYGAVSTFEGQIALFNVPVTDKRGAHYRDLFPNPPKNNEVMNCAEAGVLGVLPGVIGTMQASEAIKWITGTGKTLAGKLLTWNVLDNSTYELQLPVNEAADTIIPKSNAAFMNMDYEWLCASNTENRLEIDAETFNDLINNNNVTVIDVREKNELPFVDEFEHLQIPLSVILENKSLIDGDTVILFCQSGKRSLLAAGILDESFHSKKIYSLQHGIAEWKRQYALQQTAKK